MQVPSNHFLLGLIVTSNCKLVVKASLSADYPKSIYFPGVIQAAVTSYNLNQSCGDLYLFLHGISVCLAPGNGFLALVLSNNESRRFESAIKAREISNWFNLMHGSSLESELSDNREAGSLEKEWDHPKIHAFHVCIHDLLCRVDFQNLWLQGINSIPGLIVGAVIDFSLSDQPVFEIPGQKVRIPDKENMNKIWCLVKNQCKVLSAERATRRCTRRRARRGETSVGTKPRKSKLCCSYMKFCLLDQIVCAYLKLVRLPEHDPCLVLICLEAEDNLDSLDPSLSSGSYGLETLIVNNNEESFPACVRKALQDARNRMKACFPKSTRMSGQVQKPTERVANSNINCDGLFSDKLVRRQSSCSQIETATAAVFDDSPRLGNNLITETGKEDTMEEDMSSEFIDLMLEDITSKHQNGSEHTTV